MDLEIRDDPHGRGGGVTPLDAALELKRQANDPYSALFNGKITCYTEAISVQTSIGIFVCVCMYVCMYVCIYIYIY